MANGKGKLIGYIRVSTTDQGKRGHSLDGQATRLCARAAREGFEVVDIIREVASGAKERDVVITWGAIFVQVAVRDVHAVARRRCGRGVRRVMFRQIGAHRHDQVIIRDLRGAGPDLPLDGVDAQNFRLDQIDAPAQKPFQRPANLMRLTISRHEPEE